MNVAALETNLPHNLPWTASLEIAVTGIGLVTPIGLGCEENLESLKSARSGIRYGVPAGIEAAQPFAIAESPAVSLASRLRIPKNQKYMTRSLELAVAAALDAVQSSGIGEGAVEPERLGVFTGSGQTGLDHAEFYRALDFAWRGGREQDFKYMGGKASRLIDPYFSLKTLSNAGVALISAETGARGPSANFVQNDTAAASALSASCYELIEDRCDAVIVGGFDCLHHPGTIHAFEEAGLLSKIESGASLRPFDVESAGLALGEGAAFFVIERLHHARARGARIFAELVSIECATGADQRSQSRSMAGAIRAATESATRIDFAVARGVGVPGDDRPELECLAGALTPSIPVTAFKGYTGYLGAATATVELALGMLCAGAGFIPPIAGLTQSEPGGVDLVTQDPRRLDLEPASGLFLSASWGGPVSAILAGVSRASA